MSADGYIILHSILLTPALAKGLLRNFIVTANVKTKKHLYPNGKDADVQICNTVHLLSIIAIQAEALNNNSG